MRMDTLEENSHAASTDLDAAKIDLNAKMDVLKVYMEARFDILEEKIRRLTWLAWATLTMTIVLNSVTLVMVIKLWNKLGMP